MLNSSHVKSQLCIYTSLIKLIHEQWLFSRKVLNNKYSIVACVRKENKILNNSYKA